MSIPTPDMPAVTPPPPPPRPPSPPAAAETIVVVTKSSGPGCLVQALWFIFIGWWVGGIAITLAWFLNVIIIGLPLGMMILNNIPKILALQNPDTQVTAVTKDGVTTITTTEPKQRSFLLRAIYFLVIGWWLSGIWLGFAYVISLLIITLPLTLQMFRMTPALTTLRRY